LTNIVLNVNIFYSIIRYIPVDYFRYTAVTVHFPGQSKRNRIHEHLPIICDHNSSSKHHLAIIPPEIFENRSKLSKPRKPTFL